MSDWISVDDRMPTYGESVILSIGGVTQEVICYRDGYPDKRREDWFESRTGDRQVPCSEADHWMPLPEPPK